MTSKNSTNKISLWAIMKEDLRHRTWMIALSLLGSFIACPVAFLFFNDGNYRRYSYITSLALTPEEQALLIAEGLRSYLFNTHLGAQLCILMAGACIVAVFGFRYLYSHKTVDLYHSAPVSRNLFFLANWLNGFIIWLVPFLAGNLLVYIMALARIGMPAQYGIINAAMLKLILICILCFLIVYNGCLVAVMVSGNLMNACVNLLIYGLIVFVGNAVVVGYMQTYFSTFFTISDDFFRPLVIGLSPLAAPICLASYFSTGNLLADQLPALILCVLLLLVNFVLAMQLHRKRPSELAERGLEAKWFRLPARLAVSLFAGLALGLFFRSFSHKSDKWTLFGVIFGCILAFCVLNIIYHAGFKYLFRHKIQLILTTAFASVTLLCFHFDAFGYDAYLPSEKNIVGMSLYSYMLTNDSYRLRSDGNGHYYKEFMYSINENLVFDDAAAIHRLLEMLVQANANASGQTGANTSVWGERQEFTELSVKITTNRGSYYRNYRIYNSPEQIEALRVFVETDAFRTTYYPASDSSFPLPEAIRVGALNNTLVTIEDPDRISRLHAAYQKDFIENHSLKTASSDVGSTLLTLHYQYPASEYENYQTQIGLNCLQSYSNMIALLEEWYPELPWRIEDLKLAALILRISSAESSLDSLYTSLGIENGTATEHSVQNVRSCEWCMDITDQDTLNAWQPYLHLEDCNSLFKGKSYVYIGDASFMWSEEESVSLNCFVEYGALPAELLSGFQPVDTDNGYYYPDTRIGSSYSESTAIGLY